jgi:plastocyanin
MNMRNTILMLALAAMGTVLFAQGGHMGHAIDQNLIFPHFAVGGGYTTDVVLMNPGTATAVNGTLYFFRQDGTALTVQVNGNPVSQVAVSLPAGSIRYINLSPSAPDLVVGWALFEVSGGGGSPDPRTHVYGSVIFTFSSGGTTAGKVGVVTARYEMGMAHTWAVPVVAGGSVNTGVAAVNAGATEAVIAFRLKDINGNVIRADATVNPPLPPFVPGTQTARFVTDLFPDVDFSNFEGYLEVVTQQEGLVVAGLLTDGALLTSVPVVMVPGSGTMPMMHTVTNAGFSFSPSLLTINAGDTVRFQLDTIHNAVEVSQATWNANGNTPNGGFSVGFGGGDVLFTTPGTYYYVCQPHAGSGMKGRIVVQ